jgi:hypothetical protein
VPAAVASSSSCSTLGSACTLPGCGSDGPVYLPYLLCHNAAIVASPVVHPGPCHTCSSALLSKQCTAPLCAAVPSIPSVCFLLAMGPYLGNRPGV